MTTQEQDSDNQKVNHGFLAWGTGLLATGTALLSTTDITWIPIFVVASAIIILIIYIIQIFKN